MPDAQQCRCLLIWYGIAIVVVLLDQLTKQLVTSFFVYGDSYAITFFFNLVRVHNYGAAFSFLSDAGGWQRWAFSFVAIVVSVIIVAWLARLTYDKRLESLALALILGGALGNLWDRLTVGYVVDFLDFHLSGIHFPAFNVADSSITIGAMLLILDAFLSEKNGPDNLDG